MTTLVPKRRLLAEEKEMIVTAFASWSTAREIADRMGLPVATVKNYDAATLRNRRRLDPRWTALFDEVREQHGQFVSNIRISHRAERLQMLDDAARQALERGDTHAVVSCIREARAETGDNNPDREIARMIIEAEGNTQINVGVRPNDQDPA